MKVIFTKIIALILGFLMLFFTSECSGQSNNNDFISIIDNKTIYEVPKAHELPNGHGRG
jgi:hypothetical protein